MFNCDHQWLRLPWYSICLHCFEPDIVIIDGLTSADEQIILDPKRPWVYITINDPIFMDLMVLQGCPVCQKLVVEENGTRDDGTRYAGFTCTDCGSRWWVNEEEGG